MHLGIKPLKMRRLACIDFFPIPDHVGERMGDATVDDELPVKSLVLQLWHSNGITSLYH